MFYYFYNLESADSKFDFSTCKCF